MQFLTRSVYIRDTACLCCFVVLCRAYFKAVKEFQEECFKNEKLQEAVEAAGGAAEE